MSTMTTATARRTWTSFAVACPRTPSAVRRAVWKQSTFTADIEGEEKEVTATLMVSALHANFPDQVGEGSGYLALPDPFDIESGSWRALFPDYATGWLYDQTTLVSRTHPSWRIFNGEIPAGTTDTSIEPEHDYYIGLINGAEFVQGTQATALPLTGPYAVEKPFDAEGKYGPKDQLNTDKSWADAVSGQLATIIGYPRRSDTGDDIDAAGLRAFVTLGRILDENEAGDAIAALKASGDEEGSIGYKPKVEFLVRSKGIGGMSARRCVRPKRHPDWRSRFAVRWTKTIASVRVTRMSWIMKNLNDAFQALDEAGRQALAPYLGEAPYFQ